MLLNLLIFLSYIGVAHPFNTFPSNTRQLLTDATNFDVGSNPVRRARVDIFIKLLQRETVFNMDTFRLNETQVNQLVNELQQLGLNAYPSWYWGKYKRCMDDWALEELRCGTEGNRHFFMYDKTMERECLKRKSECKGSECTPPRRCNPNSDFCLFHPCRGIWNEIHIT
jgi:hypothetical protein